MDQQVLNFFNNDSIFREKGVIIADCDEVLCNISPKWISNLYEDFDYFNKYLNLPLDFSLEKYSSRIITRNIFYLDAWLLRRDKKFSRKELDEFRRRFIEAYNRDDFYDDLQPTRFASGLSYLIGQPYVKRIDIVTRTFDKNRDSKERFLKDLFPTSSANKKLNIYYLDVGESKADLIKTLGNDIAMIAEDETENIEDIVKNCNNLNNMIFCVPRYGYNDSITHDTYIKLKNKDNTIFYYN